MCDETVPCACTLEKRAKLRAEHQQRSDAYGDLAFRLSSAGQISEAERDMLYAQSEAEWDDAIHIASPDDPLRSLCGQYGRNLADLPDRPDGASGCWGCLQRADKMETAAAKDLVTA